MVSHEMRLREAKKQVNIVLEDTDYQDKQLQRIYNMLDNILDNNQ